MQVKNNIRKRADTVRKIRLIDILTKVDAEQDQFDKNKWHTTRGVISVNEPKFMNWNLSSGGGGAIDLIIHLKYFDFLSAVKWLEDHFADSLPSKYQPGQFSAQKKLFIPPKRNDVYLKKVLEYLIWKRGLNSVLLQTLVRSNILYADQKENAVFLLLDENDRPVGAEIRGTGAIPWKSMTAGSKKNLGYFAIKKNICDIYVLCESAIDAISYYCLYPGFNTISTSGVISSQTWIKNLLENANEVYCAYDADKTGDRAANQLIKAYQNIKRIRPPKKDWNDTLISRMDLSL